MNVNSIHTYARVQRLGKMIVSMDANFGLPRQQDRVFLHGHLFFYDQTVTDEYASQQRFISHKVYLLIFHRCQCIPLAINYVFV